MTSAHEGPRSIDRSVLGARLLALARRTLIFLVPFAYVGGVSLLLSDPPFPDGTTVIERAEFLAAESRLPPNGREDWKPRRLPDDWLSAPGGVFEGWYRLRFRVDAVSRDDLAVYLPRLSMNLAVFVNGEPIGDGGSFEEPLARNWNRPQLFRIPAETLTAGENTLSVRLRSDRADMGFLGPIAVGPVASLRPLYERSWAIRVTAVWIFTAVRVLFALFLAALWFQRPNEPYYGWSALLGLAWLTPEFNLLIADIPVPTMVWYWGWYVGTGWWALLSARFFLSFVGDRNRFIERGILAGGVAGTVLLGVLTIFAPDWLHPIGSQLWFNLTWIAAFWAAWRIVVLGRLDEVESAVIYVVGATCLGCGLHDLLADTGWRSRDLIVFPPYATPLAILGIGWILIRRFLWALRESEALVETLEDRVRRKHDELEQSYEEVRVAERDRILAEERERILRDVNDGLGNLLVTTLARIEKTDPDRRGIEATVRSALDDLRLVIDSLEPVDGDLLPALAMLRARMTPRLAAAAVDLQWQVEDLPPLRDLGPQRLLRILRLVRDILAPMERNGGGTIVVRTGSMPSPSGSEGIFVEIDASPDRDDHRSRVGEGVDEIRRRAEEIGAELELGHRPGARTVRLWIPTNPQAQ